MTEAPPSSRVPFAKDLGVPESTLPRVVVVGGGFAGIKLVRQLNSKHFQIVLLDRKNFHTFQPLLYQVATAGLDPTSIVAPFRSLFRGKKNFHFRMAELLRINPEEKSVATTGGTLRYDYLVLCHGCTTNFFGNTELEALSLPMKTIPEALDIRSLMLENFEEALVARDEASRKGIIDVVIVGGGPTGVELAGAFAELRRHVLPHDYPDLPVREMDIHLVESGPSLLGAMAQSSQDQALKLLRELDVKVHVGTPVTSYDGKVVSLSDGKQLTAGTLIWSAGIKGNASPGLPEDALFGGQRRVKVNAQLQVAGLQNVFALGDVAAVVDQETPRGHPQVAPVAIQQAELTAKNLRRQLLGQPLLPFRFKSPGTMATIGRNRAVVELGRIHFAGMIAWFVWMFVHLMAIVGFRNRFLIFLHWSINYLTYDRSFRLVFRNMRKRFGGTH